MQGELRRNPTSLLTRSTIPLCPPGPTVQVQAPCLLGVCVREIQGGGWTLAGAGWVRGARRPGQGIGIHSAGPNTTTPVTSVRE